MHSLTARPIRVLVLQTLLLIILGLLAWGAVSGGIAQLGGEVSLWQYLQTIAQLCAGALSIAVAISHLRPGKWTGVIHKVWGAALALAAGLSALVWGPPMPFIGLLFAGVATIFAWAVSSTLRRIRTIRPSEQEFAI